METARNFHKFKTNIRVSKRKTKSSMFQRSWSFGTPFRHNGKESLEKPRKQGSKLKKFLSRLSATIEEKMVAKYKNAVAR